MKDVKNNLSLNLNIHQEKTAFENFEESLKNSIFDVLYFMLKNQDFSIWIEIIFVVIQLLQLLSFTFNPIFWAQWKSENLFTQISNFLQYFQLVVFLEDNDQMYIILFYICVVLILLMVTNFIYIALAFSKNKFNIFWPIRVLRAIVSFLVTVLFLPIFGLFISIFSCVDSKELDYLRSKTEVYKELIDVYNTTRTLQTTTDTASGTSVNMLAGTGMQCWSGAYYIHTFFAVIIGIFFVIISVIIVMTYFETKNGPQNYSAKSNSKSDSILLFAKIVIVLMFGFFGSDSNTWVIAVVMFLLALFMFYSYNEDRPYYNDKIMKIYLIVTAIFLWNTFVLIIGKILENSKFDGCIALFLVGIPIIIFIIITTNEDKMTLLLTGMNKLSKGEKVITQVRYFLDLVDRRENDRDANTLLKGYIKAFEETCNTKECALKKYLFGMETGTETVVFLYQHAESMYQAGNSKFPNCTALRISFAFFLLERMKKRTQSTLELNNALKHNPKFDEQFIIYRFKKIIEEGSSESSGEGDDTLDVVSNLAYKGYFVQFRSSIARAATVYMDFWSLLLNPSDNSDDLTKLNEYGSKINSLNEEINSILEKMQKLKQNDPEVLRLYADFLNDILNDKDKALQYKIKVNEMEGSKSNIEDVNLITSDLNALSSTDEHQYVILSAQPDKFGTISNVSLAICSAFGYTKSEVLGKNIEAVMPEAFHKPHRILLAEKLNEYKKNSINSAMTKNFKPTWKDVLAFGKNKSRYLCPFNFKVTFLPNPEQDENVFIAKLTTDNSGSQEKKEICFILTSPQFIVQNFTANSISILGMSSNDINNSSVEITKYFKNFNQELVEFGVDLKNSDQVIAAKRHILTSKYKAPVQIGWIKKNMDDSKSKSNLSDLGMSADETGVVRPNNKFLFKSQNNNDDLFYVSVIEIRFVGILGGYIFKFETELEKEKKIEYNTSSNNTGAIADDHKSNLMEDLFKIDKTFVPPNESSFHIDPKKMSYLVNPKNPLDLKEALKDEAIKKLKNGIDAVNEESDDDYETEKGEENDENRSRKNTMEKRKMTQSQDDYYRVDFTNFKFLVYDFNKENLIEKHEPLMSHIEFKKTEDFKKKEEKKEKVKDKKDEKETKEGVEEEVNEGKGREVILIKQIETALNKEENQPTIVRLKWFSFIIFLIYAGLGALFLGLFLSSIDLSIVNIKMIYNSYYLIVNSIYGVYHTRELTLINNHRYIVPFSSKDHDYKKNNTETLLQFFNSSHSKNTDIITALFPLTDDNKNTLETQTIDVYIIDSDLKIKPIPLTLRSAFIETNTAVYHIGHSDISQIIPINKDVFFYIYNANNFMFLYLYKQADIYITELDRFSTIYRLNFLFIFLGVLIFGIVSFFMINYAYDQVGKRKESYLEVFFEIGSSVIRNSLEKCENFTKKVQADSASETASQTDETENMNEMSAFQLNKQSVKTHGHKKKKSGSSREDKILKLKLFGGVKMISLIFFLLYIFFSNYLGTVKNYVTLYDNISKSHSNDLFVFNYLREYFFDRTSSYMSKNINDTILQFIDKLYEEKLKIDSTISDMIGLFPSDYSDLYMTIMNNDVCSHSSDLFTILFNGKKECKSFFSNSTSYGLNILLAQYYERIRDAKFLYDRLLRDINFSLNPIYNNTIYNSNFPGSDSSSIKNATLDKIHPFNIFNEQKIQDLSIINRFIIRPAYKNLTDQLEVSINNSLDSFKLAYIVVFGIYFIALLSFYIFVWRPFENNLNLTIYKTKNMLSIIPKEVLATLSSIHRLLDIGQNFNKTSKNSMSAALAAGAGSGGGDKAGEAAAGGDK